MISIESSSLNLVLIEEYKAHKEDLHRHRAIYTNNTSYIQLLGVFLFSIYIYSFEQSEFVSELPYGIKIAVLVLGMLLIFFFFSSIISSIYMFFIIRRRMSEIETRINRLVGEQAMLYESKIAPIYFERPSPSHGIINPLSYSSIFRVLLFAVAVTALFYLATLFLTANHAAFYISGSMYVAITLLIVFARIYYLARDGFSSLDHADKSKTSLLFGIVRWFINLFIVLFLAWIIYGDGGSLLSSWALERFNAIRSANENAIFIAIAFYTMSCAILVPTPSELPIIFFGQLNWLLIVAVSAVGRATGAVILAFIVLGWRRLFPQFERRMTNGILMQEAWWKDGAAPGMYLLFQSVPFLPMRTSTIVYALAGGTTARKMIWIVVGNLSGTPVRMFLMLALISVGFASIQPLLLD